MTRKEVKENLKKQLEKNLHITIDITEEDIKKVIDFSEEMEKAKPGEAGYKTDNKNIAGRNISGKIGELALEKYLGVPFVDFSIGKSKDYNIPDLSPAGYWLGIKTARLSNGVAYVPSRPKYGEILCIYDEDNQKVYIMGLATEKVITRYGQRDLIPPHVIWWKTGFGRYDKLSPITKDLLEQYKTDNVMSA